MEAYARDEELNKTRTGQWDARQEKVFTSADSKGRKLHIFHRTITSQQNPLYQFIALVSKSTPSQDFLCLSEQSKD